ncbi:hypothetical protein LN042_11480 [Kitasatospora sp. RB6PN24]|uniref:hypothetical protein n=1 Tax=Kitasatospora humi TaxID=2893891 RepID=UPI001E5BD24E|nr:hypothetical protein [Kitasatospora humi]MCC9307710.1 hypothetical protein [Kitasatospora humi]
MAVAHTTATSGPTVPRPVMTPWYARTATTAGRPVVLSIALAMCAPGEYHLARLADWADPWAYGMPAAMSAYAGIAAVVAANRPKGSRARFSAIAGAVIAIMLALAAQVVAHEIDRGHMAGNQAWLIGIISAVPPAVVGHLLHLAATPAAAVTPVNGPSDQAIPPRAEEQPMPLIAPPLPPMPPAPPVLPPAPAVQQTPAPQQAAPAPQPTPIEYSDPRCAAIRPLYNAGTRPGTAAMRQALIDAGHGPVSDGMIRGTLRAEIERREPHLGALPSAVPARTA